MDIDQTNKGTVLIIDDNAANLNVLFYSLRQANFKVLIAEDGASAIKRVDLSHPDIILLDVRMPDTNGFELYQRLKETDRVTDTPVIFLSIVSDSAEKVRALDLNAVDYVTKPFDPREVVARVEKHLTLNNLRKKLAEKNARLQREITEREHVEEQLRAALAEKEVLIKEVYHRTKNNLMTLVSLINLQAMASEHPETTQMFKDLQQRVKAMSLVHRTLYQAEDLSRIDFGQYLRQLIQELVYTIKDERSVAWHVEAEHVLVDLNLAIPCGLIANELITNALKHAFPEECKEDTKPELSIAFKLEQGQYILSVRDNGVGLPPDLDWRKTETLGLKLVNILATHQLEGSLEVDREEGTSFTVAFPA